MKKHNEGFSLVEVLVAMAVLALIVVPTCSGMILSFRMNARTDEMMQAQLAVSSAVETLMAEGIDPDDPPEENRFPNVKITITAKKDTAEPPNTIYYEVTAESTTEPTLIVTTKIRAIAPTEPTTDPTTEPTTDPSDPTTEGGTGT